MNSDIQSLSPRQVIDLLLAHGFGDELARSISFLDVRSPGEFAQAAIPGFRNIPIMDDQERHEVGLCFKQQGRQKAIELGYRLVGPHRDKLIDKWADFAGSKAVITCWRGGLRSRISAEWLLSRVPELATVKGGYKAMRALLQETLGESHRLVVLSGPTGSKKTKLIQSLPVSSIDLEALANHRGSAFGRPRGSRQPRQASFENHLALQLLRFRMRNQSARAVLEDESGCIGEVHIPVHFRAQMRAAPVVILESPMEERIQHIFAEYVCEPLESGTSVDELHQDLASCLMRIRQRLGGAKTSEIAELMNNAFNQEKVKLEFHQAWISELLVNYYDQLYDYAFKREPRTVLFKGDFGSCQNWIKAYA